MSMDIVQYRKQKTAEQMHEDRVRAMWCLYLRCPGRDTKVEAGASQLEEIGSACAGEDLEPGDALLFGST
jgi:hypothetical protein